MTREDKIKLPPNKQEVLQKLIDLISAGESDLDTINKVNSECGTMFTMNSKLLKQAKQFYVRSIVLPEKDYYIKETLLEYDEIRQESKLLDERDKGLNIQIKVLKDRSELLGLTNGGVMVQINFDSKNLSDDDFLAAQNKVILDLPRVD